MTTEIQKSQQSNCFDTIGQMTDELKERVDFSSQLSLTLFSSEK